jgi:hypothetical protein
MTDRRNGGYQSLVMSPDKPTLSATQAHTPRVGERQPVGRHRGTTSWSGRVRGAYQLLIIPTLAFALPLVIWGWKLP